MARDTGSPGDPLWLIIQRLDDLRRAQDDFRAEMKDLRMYVDAHVAGLRADLRDLRGELGDLRTYVDAQVKELRGYVEDQIAEVRRDIRQVFWTLVGVLATTVVSLMLALFRV